MTKKPPRFVDDFFDDYFGETPEDFVSNLSRLMGRAQQFLKLCNQDFDFANALLRNHDSQETRRIYIRTVPPCIEGHLTFLHVIPHLFPPLLERIPEESRVLFAESMLAFKNRSTSKNSIRMTFVGIGAVAGIEISNELMGESGAQALMSTFRLRDNLMHPRSISGFTVSDDQIKAAQIGVVWFYQVFSSVWPPMIEIVKEIMGPMHDEA